MFREARTYAPTTSMRKSPTTYLSALMCVEDIVTGTQTTLYSLVFLIIIMRRGGLFNLKCLFVSHIGLDT